jgi:hypothetical protein
MRHPGFRGSAAPDDESSLVWLAQQMANDPRFAVGTVEFWWPVVMGSDILRAPEDPALPGYDDKLMAFNLQRSEVGRLGALFAQSGFQLKTLLKEMVASPWFTANRVAADHPYEDVLQLSGVGTKRLLTPEELQSKTQAITGVVLGYDTGWILPTPTSYLERNRIVMGGIDSYRVKKRAREFNSVAATMSEKHSGGIACVLAEVEKETKEGSRALLVDVHARLHGKNYDRDAPEIDLALQLLMEAAEFPVTNVCYAPLDTRPDVERALSRLENLGIRKDPSRAVPEVESINAYAWRMTLDYLMSHFDYLYE